MRKLLMIIPILLLTACQTARYRAFDHVKNGQTKTSVLESLGGPDRRIREEGRDRWIYVFYDKDVDNPDWKEIQFVANKVVYVGERIKPALTAEEVDRQNEEANRAEAARLDSQEQMMNKRVGRINSLPHGPRNDIEEDYYGKDIEAEKRKKAPNFEPVK